MILLQVHRQNTIHGVTMYFNLLSEVVTRTSSQEFFILTHSTYTRDVTWIVKVRSTFIHPDFSQNQIFSKSSMIFLFSINGICWSGNIRYLLLTRYIGFLSKYSLSWLWSLNKRHSFDLFTLFTTMVEK